jgi:hypothetical protein
MDLNELIEKTKQQRDTVIALMQDPKKTVDELDKEMAVERFLKGFLDDLNRVRESQNTSTSDEALPIGDVVETNCVEMAILGEKHDADKCSICSGT